MLQNRFIVSVKIGIAVGIELHTLSWSMISRTMGMSWE